MESVGTRGEPGQGCDSITNVQSCGNVGIHQLSKEGPISETLLFLQDSVGDSTFFGTDGRVEFLD